MTPEQLKQARQALGLYQQAMADELGVSRVWVGLMERGEKEIEPRTALAVECLLRRAGKWPL
ncbi:helix-turn-helix domain-containing protein [Marinobacterium litorale]|uniref:helix-turn-helix transcriptional regulator n=1 Tax=Marinobacterium litorale TaxID=404770 RepID=UPI000481A28C